MRFIKLAVISLFIIFLLFTCIGLLLPSSVTVTRQETINASTDSVRFYTNNLMHWKYWLNGVDTTTMQSSKIKVGAYTITIVNNNQTEIITLWQGKNIKERICHIHIKDDLPNSTIVSLSFQQHLTWLPWDRLGGMLHDEIIGPSLQASLLKLKQVVEKTSEKLQ